MALIECIPNISDGRRPLVIAACVDAVRATGATVLDVSSDARHNRSVLTIAGDRPSIRRAILALFASAIAAIDLRQHEGVHPRLGAVDVVPLVPLEDATMAECVDLAREVAAVLADRHALPIYLYEEAALRPDRRRLEIIRRGQFEGLAERMRQPEGAPDFGPATPHPSAGASVVGARFPLIAFNINLSTDRLDIARAIAARVRESSGGLPFVKALGVPLADRGIVQVTMNLTRFERTSLTEVFDAVTAEAAARGVGVIESEIVGLVPRAALPPDPAVRLRLPGFSDDRVLEHRLALVGGGR
jgi:glutamate formiminotransferase